MLQTDTAISVNRLEKSYKSLRVLKNISFTVRKGSIFALLGPNGAGKTTTIRILATLLKPDNGSAQIVGFDVVRQPHQVRMHISLTGQNAAVDDVLTGRENLRMIGKLRHLPDTKEKTEAMLEKFQLLDAADRRAATYSGGMRRRLDLAMSLIGNPPVLFLDEPTAGLDPQGRLEVWMLIKEMADTGITVFLTTQYLEEADRLADHIAILNDGRIVAEGTPGELKKMLPNCHIELSFRNGEDVRAAHSALSEYRPLTDGENLTLTVVADGSTAQITDILNRLEQAAIPVAEFAQKLPTLEDVFLSIIGEQQGKDDEI